METSSHIGSPLIGPVLDRVADCAEHGVHSVIVGAKGSGLSTIATMLMIELSRRDLCPVILDCRAPGTWQESLRKICDDFSDSPRSAANKLVLVVDHAVDLATDQIAAIRAAARAWKMPARQECGDVQVGFGSEVWIGHLDCRGLEDVGCVALTAEPRFVFQMPQYNSEHLITLYSAIGRRQDSEWGEAILYTILDWCGPDLALAESFGAHFYGDWRENIYDATVADAIGRWLKTDALVDEYRQCFLRLDEPGKALVGLLNKGGKIPSHSPYCNQEPDRAIRQLLLAGIVAPNLLPGFYQFRNLTMRLLALQSESDAPPVESLDLLRRYSNGRIGDILQDAEISLRFLALRCFTRMGYDAVCDKLKATRTDEQAVPTDLRKSLLDWAKANGGPDQQKALGQHIVQYQKDFDAGRNLWTRVCWLYSAEISVEPSGDIKPPLAKTVSFMTFAELSNLILSLDDSVFPRWTKGLGTESPVRKWPAYMSLLRRLRNQSAHLRNVAFQDIEDLLSAVRDMRKDIEKYA